MVFEVISTSAIKEKIVQFFFSVPFMGQLYGKWNEFVFFVLMYAVRIGNWTKIHVPMGNLVVRYFADSYQNDPFRVLLEILLSLFVIGYLFHHVSQPKRRHPHAILHLSEAEIEESIAAWRPEPLVSKDFAKKAEKQIKTVPTLLSRIGTKVLVKSKDSTGPQQSVWKTNFASFNFLNLIGDSRVESAAIESIKTYGVGTCGPRGFYGTLDTHLMLERRIAEFLGMDEAILYSYSFSTIASVIPTFAKRGDILVVDDSVSFATQRGILVSRSTIKYFKHNDMKDLEQVLKDLDADMKKKKMPLTRRYIVAEGLYLNSGDICPLPDILLLKNKYKYRLILDESYSFGVLGKTGRGVTEYYGVPSNQVDILTGSLANSLGSTGGFCAGNYAVIDHQRLSAVGYCYSASLPGPLAAAALKSLDVMEQEPSRLLNLEKNSALLHTLLKKNADILKKLDILGHAASPITHLVLKRNPSHKTLNFDEQSELLQKIINSANNTGDILLTEAKYVVQQEIGEIRPSIRLSVSAGHTKMDLENLVQVLARSVA